MTHTFSSFPPAPRPRLPVGFCGFSLALCQGRALSPLPWDPASLSLLWLRASSSVKAPGPNGMFSKGSVSPESHASEIRAKKGSGAVPI